MRFLFPFDYSLCQVDNNLTRMQLLGSFSVLPEAFSESLYLCLCLGVLPRLSSSGFKDSGLMTRFLSILDQVFLNLETYGSSYTLLQTLSALPPSLFEETISLPYIFDTLVNVQTVAVE